MLPPRLTVVTLGARDMPLLRRFYSGLGWPESSVSSDEFAAFRLEGAVLALFPLDHLAEDAKLPRPSSPEEWSGLTCAINVESEEAVDAAFAEARAAGATVLKEPLMAPWGVYSGYFADPEGNPWEIAHAPGSEFTRDGRFVFPA